MPARLQRSALPLAAIALGLAALGSLAFGDLPLSPARIWNGLTHRDELAATVLYHIRLPRLCIAALVGAALSASGLVMQAYFRNSLASPGLLGVSTGGAAGAVIAIGTGWAASSLLALPAASIVGAFIATYAVIAFARQGASTERLLLAGIALNALLGAVVSYVLSNFTLSYERNAQIIFWMIGGLEDRSWEHVLMAAPIVIGSLCLLPLGRPMDLLSLGEREAQSLGVDVPRLRAALLILSTILTALATAVSGSIGFVGLIVPHMLRLLFGAEHKRLIPLSLIGGAAFMIGCDVLGRFAGGLRVGIVTALIGGPFFLWLLRKRT
ncbi:ABC transporter permease [Nibricoccus aquaticus]|uniref:ABC transporter permease n=1 Tax=Nibricoccus aquaticus TaxID=2576891 RepID=A0A290QAG1_9BACT|nr:iron ABC transporter permease [Nibricoccus aquaticus]ATC63226.1 ABC transporter permease [Nibricoccus aquaticus]